MAFFIRLEFKMSFRHSETTLASLCCHLHGNGQKLVWQRFSPLIIEILWKVYTLWCIYHMYWQLCYGAGANVYKNIVLKICHIVLMVRVFKVSANQLCFTAESLLVDLIMLICLFLCICNTRDNIWNDMYMYGLIMCFQVLWNVYVTAYNTMHTSYEFLPIIYKSS